MKWIRLATIAFLFGGVANCALYSQLPGYGPPPGSPSNYGYNQDYGAPPIPRNDVGFFYDELSPYGDWVQTRDYGWAWFPRNVPPYWRPYTDGRWVDSEYGWTWVSNEPFGWATYHYGRWALDPRFGWLWVPGTVWGPAWVSWQQGDGYIGWAPLPPQVGFEIGMGIRLGGFNLSTGISSNAYNFVPERSFLDTRLSRYMVPTARNVTIIYNTTNITHYSYSNNRVVNRGVDVRRIEQMTGRRIQPFRVTQARAPARSSVTGNEVRIYRPDEQRLKSVRAAQSLKAAPRNLPPPMRQEQNRPTAQSPKAPQWTVAPRVKAAPRPDAQQIEQQNRRERQQLDQYLATQKQQLEKVHQNELSRARAQTDRARIESRNRVETQALQEERQRAVQQLQTRQMVKRQAVLESQPPRPMKAQDTKKAAGQKDKQKQNEKKNQKPEKDQQKHN